MTRDRYAELARRFFLRTRREAPPHLSADRRRLVGAIEQALRLRARRRATARWLASGGAVAVAAAAAFVLVPNPWFRHGQAGAGAPALVAGAPGPVAGAPGPIAGAPGPVVPTGPAAAAPDRRALAVLRAADQGDSGAVAPVVSGGAARPIVAGMRLQAGIRLVAPETGEVQIGTAEGTSLTLDPGADLRVSEAGATMRFALSRGAVRAHVAKLTSGERFIVETDDAEIEVHGTTFRVALADPDATCDGRRTRVSVEEGVVTVSDRASGAVAHVAGGGAWLADCPAPAMANPGPAAANPSPATAPAIGNGAGADRRARPARASAAATSAHASADARIRTNAEPTGSASSELAAQNDLFAAAMRAARRHDTSEALGLLTSFVKRYPQSPLFEHALAERMKLLAATDPWGAAEAANEYLSRFPTGFARLDARALTARARQ